MDNNNKFAKHLVIILKEMCKRVKAPFKKIDFKKDGWYSEYSWSQKEENSFKSWLTNYLYENSEARKEIMASPSKNKKMCQRAASFFVLSYGWKYK